MSEQLSDCCGVEVTSRTELAGITYYCTACGKPCNLSKSSNSSTLPTPEVGEIREKIAKEIYNKDLKKWQSYGSWGMPTWERLPDYEKQKYYIAADSILRMIAKEGYVKLAKDQKYPVVGLRENEDKITLVQRVRKLDRDAGWRKTDES